MSPSYECHRSECSWFITQKNCHTRGDKEHAGQPTVNFYHRGGKKNFSRAAEALSVSQPAISQHIHSIEDYYGARLFERSSKRVELTQAGVTLYGYAKEILELHRVAKRAVSDLVERVVGNINIGASFTVGEYVPPRLLAAFSKEFPDVKFSVYIGNTEFVHERTRENSIDIGLVEGMVDDPHLTIGKFLDDEMVLVISPQHPLAGAGYIEPDQVAQWLGDAVFVIREEGSGTRLTMENVLRKLNFEPSHIITLGSTQAIKEAVEANLGVSMLSKWTLRKELQLGSIKPVRIKDFSVNRGFYLIQHREKFQSRACAEFCRFVLDQDLAAVLR